MKGGQAPLLRERLLDKLGRLNRLPRKLKEVQRLLELAAKKPEHARHRRVEMEETEAVLKHARAERAASKGRRLSKLLLQSRPEVLLVSEVTWKLELDFKMGEGPLAPIKEAEA
jgi:hypothetical protein